MSDVDERRTVQVREDGACATLTVSGELDLDTVGELAEAGRQVLLIAADEVHLDVSAVTFCDACGLTGLVRLRQRCEAIGRPLVLDGASRSLRRLLEVTQLEHLLLPNPPAGRAADPLEVAPHDQLDLRDVRDDHLDGAR